MGMMEAVSICFKKYVTFSGRARRSEYWWFYLFNIVVSTPLSLLLPFLGWIFSLAIFLPFLAVSVRRLHDIDRTGWWTLIQYIPILLIIPAVIQVVLDPESGFLVLAILGVMFVGGWVVMLIFTVMRGTDGPNRFGEDPISGSPENVF